jgi:hypothetical protein
MEKYKLAMLTNLNILQGLCILPWIALFFGSPIAESSYLLIVELAALCCNVFLYRHIRRGCAVAEKRQLIAVHILIPLAAGLVLGWFVCNFGM